MNKQTTYHMNHVLDIYDAIASRQREGFGINLADVAILTLAVVNSELAEQTNHLVRVTDKP